MLHALDLDCAPTWHARSRHLVAQQSIGRLRTLPFTGGLGRRWDLGSASSGGWRLLPLFLGALPLAPSFPSPCFAGWLALLGVVVVFCFLCWVVAALALPRPFSALLSVLSRLPYTRIVTNPLDSVNRDGTKRIFSRLR